MMYGHFQEDRFVGQLYSSTAHDNYKLQKQTCSNHSSVCKDARYTLTRTSTKYARFTLQNALARISCPSSYSFYKFQVDQSSFASSNERQ